MDTVLKTISYSFFFFIALWKIIRLPEFVVSLLANDLCICLVTVSGWSNFVLLWLGIFYVFMACSFHVMGLEIASRKSTSFKFDESSKLKLMLSIYIYNIYIYIYIYILQSSISGVGNNSIRTNKLFKFRIFKYSWQNAQCKIKFTEQIILLQEKKKKNSIRSH